MKRVFSIIFICFLVIFIFMLYFYLAKPEKIPWFLNSRDIFIPVLVFGKTKLKILRPTYWVFLGMLGLVYLKILWKLISFNWSMSTVKDRHKKVRELDN